MKTIKALSRLKTTTVRIPGSKSITHRAIIAASLADGESLLRDFLQCEDTLYTLKALRELGADISIDKNDLKVLGTGGNLLRPPIRKELFLGNSGTSFRLLVSVIALGVGEFLMSGTERMFNRPIGSLVKALNQLGVEASCVDGNDCPPVLIKANGIRGGKVSIPGDQSSQFLSSLLLTAPYAEDDIEITLIGDLVSRPYVDVTIDVMEQFGVRVDRDNYSRFRIPSGQRYNACEFPIQGDASSASYFWAAAAVTGGSILTENIHPFTTRQGDIRFLEILEKMGCIIKKGSSSVAVQGGVLEGIETDMSAMPDLVPTLAAIALFAKGKTVIKNVPHLRYKESDRLKAVRQEWERLGAKIEELPDGLVIHGRQDLVGAVVDPHDDHRMAMSLAVVGLKARGVRIKDEDCVKKSFPGFWGLWDQL